MVMSEGLPLNDGEGYVEVRGFASRIWRERLEGVPLGVECLNELKEEGLPLRVSN